MNLNFKVHSIAGCRYILSQIDRDPMSPTVGCCDRNFWAWKSKDFPDSILQYSLMPLLRVLKAPPKELMAQESRYYLGTAILAAKFLCKIQHANGSFDKSYPNELSPGIVFSVLPLWISLLNDYKKDLGPELFRTIEKGFNRAVSYVLRNKENYAVISNHLVHYAYVLLLIDKIWSQPECKKLGQVYINILLRHQSAEGWYLEYEGPDMGYQTRTLSYITRILTIFPDEELKQSALKSLQFISSFAYPDGSFGGEIGSRNTSIIYPYGFAWLAKYDSTASAVLSFLIKSLDKGQGVLLHQTDLDNFIRLFDDHIETQQLLQNHKLLNPAQLPMEKKEVRIYYKDAGIFVNRNSWYYAVVNFKKGGIYKVFNVAKNQLVRNDTGWVYKNNVAIFSNQMQQQPLDLKVETHNSYMKGFFFRSNHKYLNPIKFILLRFFNLTFWRFQWIADLAKSIIVKALFTQKIRSDITFERYFEWGKNIKVKTILNWGDSKERIIQQTSQFISVPMASSKYFQISDIQASELGATIKLQSGQRHFLEIAEPQELPQNKI